MTFHLHSPPSRIRILFLESALHIKMIAERSKKFLLSNLLFQNDSPFLLHVICISCDVETKTFIESEPKNLRFASAECR